jgi:hypothetical protein
VQAIVRRAEGVVFFLVGVTICGIHSYCFFLVPNQDETILDLHTEVHCHCRVHIPTIGTNGGFPLVHVQTLVFKKFVAFCAIFVPHQETLNLHIPDTYPSFFTKIF